MPIVERILAGDREAFRQFLHDERPVVVSSGARHFAACDKWNPAYLTQRVGGVVVDYKLSRSHLHPDFRAPTLKETFARGRGTVAELLTAITTGDVRARSRRLFTGDERFLLRRRDGETTIDPELGVLLDDVEVPDFFPERQLYTVWGWLSGQGVRTWLHYDNNGCHNLNAQITGAKRCVLFAPSDLHVLRPFQMGSANPATNCSEVEFETEAQRLALAMPYEAELAPGDLLFIPRSWFHTFEHCGEFNSNVNFWFLPDGPATDRVARRQAVLDAVGRAGIEVKPGSETSNALSCLDAALCGAPLAEPDAGSATPRA